MELTDDDALGTIDDERAELGEQRELTEIDFFFDDVRGALFAAGLLRRSPACSVALSGAE
ncbi:MAG: hypothetical protein U5K74_15480 [Gemmatimonadaceae bacterium]|nr:hypothetical protein [Gemmatimonadaceae bacterium]